MSQARKIQRKMLAIRMHNDGVPHKSFGWEWYQAQIKKYRKRLKKTLSYIEGVKRLKIVHQHPEFGLPRNTEKGER